MAQRAGLAGAGAGLAGCSICDSWLNKAPDQGNPFEIEISHIEEKGNDQDGKDRGDVFDQAHVQGPAANPLQHRHDDVSAIQNGNRAAC